MRDDRGRENERKVITLSLRLYLASIVFLDLPSTMYVTSKTSSFLSVVWIETVVTDICVCKYIGIFRIDQLAMSALLLMCLDR